MTPRHPRALRPLWRCRYKIPGYHGRWIYNPSWVPYTHNELGKRHAPDSPLARRLLQALPEPDDWNNVI